MNTDITIDDLKAASCALEGWLDAFGDEDDFAEDAVSVRRVMERIDRVIASSQSDPKRSYLRLVENPEEQ